jgi:DNA processing protein
MGGVSGPADRSAGVAGEAIRLARAYLSRVAEPASLPVWAFVVRHGPVEAAARIRAGEVPGQVDAATSARRHSADPAADLESADRHGIRLVVPESAEWPHFAFASLHSATRSLLQRQDRQVAGRDDVAPVPPLALWAKGDADLDTLGVRSVAIVGARAATEYGQHVALQLAFGVAQRGIAVISGGAHGIDAAAHRGALAAEGLTVLVSAAGLDRPYPPANAGLFDRVSERGVLISESPPGASAYRRRFLSRNRLIAALATGTVVVEAAARSGARNTARHSWVLGRPVMAVPGPITSAMSAGCHELLRRDCDPAILVTSADDVLAVVGSAGEGLAPERPVDGTDAERDPTTAALDGLDASARRVFDGLPARGWVREDTLAVRSGVSAAEVLRALPMLRLAGLIESSTDGHRLAGSVGKRIHAGRPVSVGQSFRGPMTN